MFRELQILVLCGPVRGVGARRGWQASWARAWVCPSCYSDMQWAPAQLGSGP